MRPALVFSLDETFDQADRISALLTRPEVQRDLHASDDEDETSDVRLSPSRTAGLLSTNHRVITSARVVERVRRATGAKAGHAGTLDPLATGVLPVALGEATKTIAYAVNGPKRYRFRIRWGIARSTDDCEGEIVAESRERPSRPEIERDITSVSSGNRAKAAGLFRAQDRRPPLLRAGPRRAEAVSDGATGRNFRSAADRGGRARSLPISRRPSAKEPISGRSLATLPRPLGLWVTSLRCVAYRSGSLPKNMQCLWSLPLGNNIFRWAAESLLPVEAALTKMPGRGSGARRGRSVALRPAGGA